MYLESVPRNDLIGKNKSQQRERNVCGSEVHLCLCVHWLPFVSVTALEMQFLEQLLGSFIW